MSRSPELLILVDENDRETGTMEKLQAHREARLHRAFSVFLTDGDRMLLQKRADGKYHSGGLWANACCSHPRAGQSLAEACRQRLMLELGIPEDRLPELQELFSFTYCSPYENGLTEHEFDHVFLGTYPEDGPLSPDPEELSALRWVPLQDLSRELQTQPELFATWFRLCAPRVLEILNGKE